MQRVSYLILLHWENDIKVMSQKIDKPNHPPEGDSELAGNQMQSQNGLNRNQSDMILRQSVNSSNTLDVFKNIKHMAASKKSSGSRRKNSLNVKNYEMEYG